MDHRDTDSPDVGIRLVTDEEELNRLHALGEERVEGTFACSGRTSWKHPPHGVLQHFGRSDAHEVAVLYARGHPTAYIAVEKADGHILWLVLLHAGAATPATVQALCDWCLTTYGACWGSVTNDAVRALFEGQDRAHLDGPTIKWAD